MPMNLPPPLTRYRQVCGQKRWAIPAWWIRRWRLRDYLYVLLKATLMKRRRQPTNWKEFWAVSWISSLDCQKSVSQFTEARVRYQYIYTRWYQKKYANLISVLRMIAIPRFTWRQWSNSSAKEIQQTAAIVSEEMNQLTDHATACRYSNKLWLTLGTGYTGGANDDGGALAQF